MTATLWTPQGRPARPVTAPAVDPSTWEKLAAPFDASWIEKLPKQLRRDDHDKARCEQGTQASADGHFCGGWHARSVHLDYIGHAGITMRLNDVVGPGGWELRAVVHNPDGTPVIPRTGEFWAELNVLGVVKRDVAANYNSTQEAWGDALRRCALRFGVGTYLWAKSEYAAELAAHRDPLPGEDPAEAAQVAAFKLAERTWDLDSVNRAEAHNGALLEQPIKFRGNSMTLGGAFALARAEANDRAREAAKAPAATAPTTTQEPAQEPSAPATTPEDPAPVAVQQGETPQEAADDLAREVLKVDTKNEALALYDGAGEDLRALDVLHVLGDDDLAALGVGPEVTAVALGALIIAVGKHITAHGHGIRGVPDEGEPVIPDPHDGRDPWTAGVDTPAP